MMLFVWVGMGWSVMLSVPVGVSLPLMRRHLVTMEMMHIHTMEIMQHHVRCRHPLVAVG